MIKWLIKKIQAYLDKRFERRLNRVLKSHGINADLLIKGQVYALDGVTIYKSNITGEKPFTPTKGDILVIGREGNPNKTVYIYKQTYGDWHTCYATTCGNIILTEVKHGIIKNHIPKDITIRLAFRDERDLFLSKLEESGYYWNAAQCELIPISPKNEEAL